METKSKVYQQYDFITEVVFEGIPGAGKTTVISEAAKHYAQTNEWVVFVNGRPHECQQEERAVTNFLDMRYNPDIRMRRILTTSCLGIRMAADRLRTYEEMRKKHETTGKGVIHLLERDDFSAIRLFLPALYVHLKPPIDWIDFRGMIEQHDAVATAIHLATEPRLVVVIYFDINTEMAFERVKQRNRPSECRGLERWYMHYLKRAHHNYLGLIAKEEEIDNCIARAPGRRLTVIDVDKYDGDSSAKLVNRVITEIDKHVVTTTLLSAEGRPSTCRGVIYKTRTDGDLEDNETDRQRCCAEKANKKRMRDETSRTAD